MFEPPDYIQKSGLLEAPRQFPWKGEGQHFGPSEGTVVHKELARLATCGIVAMAALMGEWLLYRLRASIDLERYLHYLDATLAWQLDHRYRDEEPLKKSQLKNIPAHQVLSDALWLIGLVAKDDYQVGAPETNVNSAASLVHITRYVLPPKQRNAFTKWFRWAVARAAQLDPRPRGTKPKYTQFVNLEEYYRAVRHYFGSPVPREALDPQAGFQPKERRARLSALLARLEHQKNPFLRSPAQMKKLGFAGKPYQL